MYYLSFNEETGVYLTKSGTDFESFTNFKMLEGVEMDDFKEF